MSISSKIKVLRKYRNKEQPITSGDEYHIDHTIEMLGNIKNTKELRKIVSAFGVEPDSVMSCVMALQAFLSGGQL